VPDEQVYTAALEWAATFVGGPTVALRAAKQAVDQGLEVDLDTGLEVERLQFAGLFATDDAKIGMRAFAEKAKPKFTGQ
jgi:enoyl-CoA hydratase/carnithine racemase